MLSVGPRSNSPDQHGRGPIWPLVPHKKKEKPSGPQCGVDRTKIPGPVKIFCLKAGGSQGCWRLREEHFFGAEIVCLQEVRMSPAEFDNFARLNQSLGYKCFYQPGPMTMTLGRWGDDRFQGGVAILVHKSVSHKYSHAVNEVGVQIMGIWVRGFHLSNIYSPPGRSQIATKVLGEFFQALHLHNKAWLVLGDFNELPTEGAAGTLLQAFGGKIIEGSRWNSHGLVDWAISNSAKTFSSKDFKKRSIFLIIKVSFWSRSIFHLKAVKDGSNPALNISDPRVWSRMTGMTSWKQHYGC